MGSDLADGLLPSGFSNDNRCEGPPALVPKRPHLATFKPIISFFVAFLSCVEDVHQAQLICKPVKEEIATHRKRRPELAVTPVLCIQLLTSHESNYTGMNGNLFS